MPDDNEAAGAISAAESALELRADHVSEGTLKRDTVETDIFDRVQRSLTDNSLCLIVGPRGCGKTHMMRYAWLRCLENKKLPLAVYVSFNRYLRLEPFLSKTMNAASSFNMWVLARIVQAVLDVKKRLDLSVDSDDFAPNEDVLLELIGALERAASLTPRHDELASQLSIEIVSRYILSVVASAGRSRAVILLDDAALTLTPDYLVEFFDIVRALKGRQLAPKCSVYPGSTEYGPRFHARQEAKEIRVWLDIESPTYLTLMDSIGSRRYPQSTNSVSAPVRQQLAYASFGIPRAYLTLLQNISELESTTQANINRVVQDHRDGVLAEYKSLTLKIPKFATLISTGEALFLAGVEALREANAQLEAERQLVLGIDGSDFNQLTNRMVKFMVEAGLVYELSEVSHGGPERTYRRFILHLAALMAVRAFSGGRRGQSPTEIVAFLSRPGVKHPVRRKMNRLIMDEMIQALRIDLPPCQNCSTQRISETQKFCHNCGAPLVDGSNFARIMGLPFSDVPLLSEFQRRSLVDIGLRTIGDLISLEDPGSELQKAHLVGQKRSEKIINITQSYIDEFLS